MSLCKYRVLHGQDVCISKVEYEEITVLRSCCVLGLRTQRR